MEMNRSIIRRVSNRLFEYLDESTSLGPVRKAIMAFSKDAFQQKYYAYLGIKVSIVLKEITERNKIRFTPPINKWLDLVINADQFINYIHYLKGISPELYDLDTRLFKLNKKIICQMDTT